MAPVSWAVSIDITVTLGTATPAAQAPDFRGAVETEGLSGCRTDGVVEHASCRFSMETLLNSKQGFSLSDALNTALCSYLAYSSSGDMQITDRSRWGCRRCRPLATGDADGFMASTDGGVVVAFRGTQQTANWLINLNAGWTGAAYGAVHRGFHGTFTSVRSQLESALIEAGAGGKRGLLTGHSLGGALATIAAAEWSGRYPVAWAFTFGQPAVGVSGFRSFLRLHYPSSFYRFVNDNDIVTRVPPGYRHVGRLVHFDSHGRVIRERLAESAGADETPTMSCNDFEQLKQQLQVTCSAAPTAINESLRYRGAGTLVPQRGRPQSGPLPRAES